jgi:glycosyltransferase involved in cell wall biosynthesis
VASVLFVTSNTPGRFAGGALATLETIRALREKDWDVDLVMNSGGPELNLGPEVAALCRKIVLQLPGGMETPKSASLLCLLRYGYTPRYHRQLWNVVEPLLRSGDYDLLLLDHLNSAECGRFAKRAGIDIPIVLREHNVESDLHLRAFPYLRSTKLRLEALPRIRRYRAIEGNLRRYCDLAIPVSNVDAARLASMNPGFPVEPVSPAVDMDHFRPCFDRRTRKELVFIGGLGWRPNEDAVRWFVRDVLDEVLVRHPDAHLTVIGDEPPEWLAAHRQVTAAGFVEDERELMAQARVVIVPIRFGSGVRIKILNALAMGKPVVSTRLGAEGIPVQDGRSILLADEAATFADAVCSLLEDERQAARIGMGGLQVCLKHYGARNLADRLDRLLRRVIFPADEQVVEVPEEAPLQEIETIARPAHQEPGVELLDVEPLRQRRLSRRPA